MRNGSILCYYANSDRVLVIDEEPLYKQIGMVVNAAGRIEYYLDLIIIEYFYPEINKQDLFRRTLLQPSFLQFSAKVKIVSAIIKHENWGKFDMMPFHTIMKIRNAFAHNDISTKARFDYFTLEGPDWVLSTSKANGTYEELDRNAAYDKFMAAATKAEKILVDIYKKIETQ